MRVLHLALSAAAALTLSTTLAFAQSTPGTVVTNTIDLSYTAGGGTVSVPSAASAAFTVDRKIDLNVDGLNGGGIVYAEQGANDPVLSYLVQNLGNDTQGFDINVTSAGTLGLIYDPAGTGAEGTFWVAISNSPTPGAGNEVIHNATGTRNAGNLTAGGIYYVHVYANVANTATSGQSRTFEVIATTLNAGSNVITAQVRNRGLDGIDTVFADPDLNGLESATESLQINAPELTATKIVTVVSENPDGTFNCVNGAPVTGAEASIPGACVEYTITVRNGAGATLTATNLQIKDQLPDGVTYAGHTPGSFTSVTRSGSTVTGTLATLAPGGEASFRIRATIGN